MNQSYFWKCVLIGRLASCWRISDSWIYVSWLGRILMFFFYWFSGGHMPCVPDLAQSWRARRTNYSDDVRWHCQRPPVSYWHKSPRIAVQQFCITGTDFIFFKIVVILKWHTMSFLYLISSYLYNLPWCFWKVILCQASWSTIQRGTTFTRVWRKTTLARYCVRSWSKIDILIVAL